MIPRKKRLERHTWLRAKKRDSLQRRTRMRQVSKKRKTRVGKLGIVRLVGEDLEKLRRACFERDGWACVECGTMVSWDGFSVINNYYRLRIPKGEMAHIRTKRNNGDVLSNVRTLCPDCHRKEHNGGKPCKSKKELY